MLSASPIEQNENVADDQRDEQRRDGRRRDRDPVEHVAEQRDEHDHQQRDDEGVADPPADVCPGRQRRAPDPLQAPALAHLDDPHRDVDERRRDDGQGDDPRHVVGRGVDAEAVDLLIAEQRREQEQEDDREHDGEEHRRRAAPEDLLLEAELMKDEGRRAHRSALGPGQLEIDVLEARPGHLEMLELDPAARSPSRSARCRLRVGSGVRRTSRPLAAVQSPATATAQLGIALAAGTRRS